MTPPDKAPSRPPADSTDKRIKKRLAIAGGVVVLALGAAALLTPSRPKVETTTGSPQTSSGKIVNKDASGNVIEQLEASSALTSPPPVASAPAARAAAPQASPGLPSSPDTGRTPALAAVGPAELLPPPAAPAVKPAPANPAKQQPSTQPPMVEVQKKLLPIANAPTAPSKPAVPTAVAAAPAKPEGSSLGYQLQLGLFNSTENADKLVKALKEKGIEAHTETRVTVGPYHSRAEAEEAIAMLKGFGYQPLLQPVGPTK